LIAAKAGEPSWDSPWGKGRPGWHIECSVMAMQYLGETIDIHGGGSDLIFPHHENEIAQSEALTGQPFVNYWMHNGFITVNNEKMSKSLGNFFILRDVLAKFPADVVRFYLVATHYRSPLDFDDGKLQEAGRALGRLKNTLNLVEEFVAGREKSAEKIGDHPLLQAAEDTRRQFIEAMDDDFNTARAISYLFELSHKINTFIASASAQDSLQQTVVQKARDVLRELGDVLGIFIKKDRKNDKAVADILNIFKDLRQEARSQKDFVLADEIRNFLSYCEVVMEDTPSGTRFRYSQEPPIDQLVQKLLDIREGFKREKNYQKADMIRNYLQETGIMIEDTPKGVRWRIADA
jgi:cysteinyl-tRNA synthetase